MRAIMDRYAAHLIFHLVSSTDVDPEEDNKVFELLYDYETTQLKRDAFSREVTFAGTNRSAIYIESVGSTAHNLGVLRGDKIALCIPLIDPNSNWWGRSLGHDSVPICRSGQPLGTHGTRAGSYGLCRTTSASLTITTCQTLFDF